MLREWLSFSENRKLLDTDRLLFLLDELNEHSVSIKGSKAFSITYSLVGNVRILVVKYL